MRKRFLLSLLVALLTTLSTHAYDFQSGDLYYNITSDTTVEVTYQDYPSSYNYQGLTTDTIPETVTYNGTAYSVTSIRNYAFAYCSSLTSITIPNSVTSIGEKAFYGCSALTSMVVESGNTVYDSREKCNAIIETASNTLIAGCQSTIIPNSVTSIGSSAFYGCSALTSIILPNSVTSIGNYAFRGCYSLTSITIPNSVTSIGSSAFYGCSALTSIILPNSVTSIGDYAFCSCSSLTSITIPNSVTSIGGSAFSGCTSLPVVDNLRYADTYLVEAVDKSLSTYTIKAGTKWIGWYAFYDCSSLISITLPNSVTSIGGGAFEKCSSLTSITIPNSVTSIGNFAFKGCTSLPVEDNLRYADTYLVEAVDKSLSTYTIKAGTKWIGYEAFWYCSSLTSITIPNSVTSIGGEAFGGCSSLTSITIGNSVTSIGEYAFSGCTSLPVEDNLRYADTYLVEAIDQSLSTYTIKAGTKWIGSEAFQYCRSLTSIILPNTVTSIGAGAFAYCSSLTSITIPNSVTSIGELAFADCSKLGDIYCHATTPPMCETNTFAGVSKNCYIHVPAGTVQDYQLATGWSDFFYYYEIEEEEQAIQTAEQYSQPSRKILRNGQVLILRNGVTYDMMGQTL